MDKCRSRWLEDFESIPDTRGELVEGEAGWRHFDKHHICHRNVNHYGICICECGATQSVGRMLKKHSGS